LEKGKDYGASTKGRGISENTRKGGRGERDGNF